MKVLVIGGTGFIGRHVCSRLTEEHDVYSFSRSVLPKKKLANSNVKYIQGDILDKTSIFEAISEVDYVLHLGSSVIPSTSNSNPVFDVQTNLVGALNILEACVQFKIKKLVFISSGGTIYGEGHGEGFKEEDPTNPICSYGIVKLAIEKYIQMYHSLHGLPYAILRVSNPYGPGQIGDKPLGAVSIFIDRILHDEPIEIWGDGSISRDFIYISDVVDAIYRAIFSQNGEILVNIGSGVAISLKELVEKISMTLEYRPEVIYKSVRTFDVKSTFLDISKSQQCLGWAPVTALEDGIIKTSRELLELADSPN